jgi:hypothetical protein
MRFEDVGVGHFCTGAVYNYSARVHGYSAEC